MLKQQKDAIKTGKTREHDGRSKKVGKEFVMAEREEAEDDDDTQTEEIADA